MLHRLQAGALALAAVAAFAGCTSPSAQVAPDFASIPIWEVGDTWSYANADDTFRQTYRVDAVTLRHGRDVYELATSTYDEPDLYGGQMWVDAETLGTVEVYTPTLGLRKTTDCEPLLPAITRTIQCTERRNGQTVGASERHILAGEAERVDTPAGTFIARKLSWTQAGEREPSQEDWYAPQAGYSVQYVNGPDLMRLTETTYRA